MPETRLGCVILAAGASRRMGEPKQLLEVRGRTLLENTLSVVRSLVGAEATVTVLGGHADSIRSKLGSNLGKHVHNHAWSEGLSSSLRCGLQALRREVPDLGAVLFCLADQPLLDSRCLRALIAGLGASPPPQLVASRYHGHLGAPCILCAPEFDRVDSITGDRGLRAVFEALDPDQIHAVDLPELAVDLDSPRDVTRFRESYPDRN